MIPIELTHEELVLVRNALSAFMADFGHHEHDLIHQVRELLGKMPVAS
jgi:DNA-binding GntR family transcriptional regulator